ncbi:MAG: transglutaminase family protein [Acidimicrobiia bacterium]|nr:MAG: transglutaminase family protein [Acidimicrobiia bacterium]
MIAVPLRLVVMVDPAYLCPTAHVDADHPAVREFAEGTVAGLTTPREKAVALFYAVRDGIRYTPYGIDLSPEAMRASATLSEGKGFCIPKALLLTASARAVGVPARLGFADVRNHLASQRLLDLMGGNEVFAWHAFTEFFLNDRWLKATPAFDIGLCERFGVRPLEFDGTTDALFHPFDAAGRPHMEYVRERGSYADLPLEEIRETFERLYPAWVEGKPDGDLHAEATAEGSI